MRSQRVERCDSGSERPCRANIAGANLTGRMKSVFRLAARRTSVPAKAPQSRTAPVSEKRIGLTRRHLNRGHLQAMQRRTRPVGVPSRGALPMRVWHGPCYDGLCLFEIDSRIKELQTTLRTCRNRRLNEPTNQDCRRRLAHEPGSLRDDDCALQLCRPFCHGTSAAGAAPLPRSGLVACLACSIARG